MGDKLNSNESFPARAQELLLRVNSWLLLTTIAILPLAYAPGVFLDVYNMPKLVLLLVVVSLAASARIASLALGAPPHGLRLLRLPALMMASAFTASWVFSTYRGWSLLGQHIRYSGLLPYLAVILFAVLVADAFAGRPRPLVVAAVAGGAAVGFVALLQMLFLGADITLRSDTGYVTSTLGHSNFAGGYLAIMLPLAITLWMEPTRLARVSGMAATILIASGLLFTVSQGAWLAGSVGIAVLVALRLPPERRWQRRGIALAAGLAALAGLGSVLVTIVVPHALARLPDSLATAVSRGFLWRNAARMGLDQPIFGWGPNVFAVEGPLHRSVEDALLLNFVKGDDPHSVPLAMFANLGTVGLLAFLLLFVWCFRSLSGRTPLSSLDIGLASGVVAYLVQAMVSVDTLPLRFAFWVLLAAVAAGSILRTQDRFKGSPTKLRRAVAMTSLIAGLAAAATAVIVLGLADAKARQATDLFAAGKPEAGITRFVEALNLRDDPEYRRQFGGTLGDFAYEQRDAGEPLIQRMNKVFSYLDDFPDPQALALQARLLNQWSRYDPSANSDALDLYARARRLDPYNPLLALEVADIFLQEGQPQAAESELEPFEELLIQSYPEYSSLYSELWAGLAIARIQQGAIGEGTATLERATMRGSCRYIIATQLLRPAQDERSLGYILAFLCPRPLLQLLPDQGAAASST